MKTSVPAGKDMLAARLASYGAAAGAMMLTANNITGQVYYSGIQNLVFDSPGILNPLDLNQDGVTDFNVGLAWDSFILNPFSTYSAFIQNPGTVNGWIGTAYSVYRLSAGYMINNLANWTNDVGGYYNLGIAPSAVFLGAGNAIMGIRFTSTGGTKGHYGWMRINIDPWATEFVVVDWAYNEEHIQPIEAGMLNAGQVPPEPRLSTDETDVVHGDFRINIDFSEPVNSFSAADIRVSGGSAVFGSLTTPDNQHYTAIVHPETEGGLIIKIPGSCVTDRDGNFNMPGANRLYLEYLEVPVPVLSTVVSEPVEGPFDAEVNFNEAVTGFIVSDFILTNCEIDPGSFVNHENTRFTFKAIPLATGPVMIELPAGVVSDGDGHSNLAAEALVVDADFDSPRVLLSTEASTPVTGVFTVDVEFSESVNGLAEYEIEVENGFISAGSLVSSGPAQYRVDIIPAASGEVIVYLPAGVAHDEDDFGNLESDPLVISAEIPDGTSLQRNKSLIACYPNPAPGSFTLGIPDELTGCRLEVINSSGSPVYTSVLTDRLTNIDLKGFPAGLYMVRIAHAIHLYSHPLIIE